MTKLLFLIAVILVLSYGNEYFRLKSFGCWPIIHAGLTQLFVPSHGKVRVAEEESEIKDDKKVSPWSYNRTRGLLEPCLIIFGIIFAADLVYSPFGGVLENLISTLLYAIEQAT